MPEDEGPSLTDFRMSPEEARSRLDSLLPRIEQAACEQDDSRFLQWRLLEDVGSDSERDQIYDKILSSVPKLACDVFGNFVVQKVFDRGTLDQRRNIADSLQGQVFSLSTNRFGCRVIQKLLEKLPTEEQSRLVSELEGRVLECVEDMHGNHVIQVMVKTMPAEKVDFVVDAVAGNADKLASHMYGCRVLQRLLEKCPITQVDSIVKRMTARAQALIQDLHGNYVAQCILEHGRMSDKLSVIEVIRKNLLAFSKNKVSSNVVEKCFAVCTTGDDAARLQDERKSLYALVLGKPEEDARKTLFKELCGDKFGNYTAQCVIRHSRGADRELVKQRIGELESELQTAAGRHVVACWRKVESNAD